jgi:hypothetical protein
MIVHSTLDEMNGGRLENRKGLNEEKRLSVER